MPAASVASAPVKRTANKTTASRSAKKPAQSANKKPQTNGATNGASQAQMSPYTIMASRIANRVAEMAENMTFVEREKPQPQQQQQQQSAPSNSGKKPPRKLEMRMPNNGASPTNITFSAPFLDNTLAKLLTLQNRMLTVSNDIAACEDVDDKTKQEQFAQSAELSRIIALICAEKARQGA
ncbi:unnamed protein product [Alternaria alternata]|uniref:Uncharacterized protein n=3 Tax=Alternaria sect. Alternaria TaxID=2499237 RepID=A0A177DAE7_ALTAL|nr:hypothetical protein CC77DRAFT_1043230 [Alternaria alternata]KAB2104229.1 hypothetical protein AG0111_0g7660 [Alternaria gaisen]RYN99464.1 hypothetical protein AA0120_g1816 [Alternaria tenuissima]OAG16438.1 hypothetical protein CC77DRAFT_1043230 [Alternaria alternata]RYN77395.1 hypothetical protein AA0117_g5052 [Alternaria alternata]RYO09603.1 hypothetical protein AA0119_g938 [Alternaria tenuissima]